MPNRMHGLTSGRTPVRARYLRAKTRSEREHRSRHADARRGADLQPRSTMTVDATVESISRAG